MLRQVDTSSGQVSGVDDLSAAASSVVNWETDESGISVPRPGLATYTVSNAGTTASLGLVRWKNYLVNVTADRYVRVLSDYAPNAFQVVSTATAATQVPGTARVTWVIGDQYVYIAGGGQVVRWTNNASPPEALSSSPPLVTHIATLGQRLIANDLTTPDEWYWTDIGESAWTSWPSANTTAAEARPDPIVALSENTNELFIWGTETTQVYAVGVDPTLPFDLVGTINTGMAAPYAFTRLDSSFAFLDDKRRVVISDGRGVESISDAIQKTLRATSFDVDDCWLYREERGQHSYLVTRFPTEKRTFAYDMKGQRWGERDYYDSPFHVDYPVASYAYWPAFNYHMFGSTTSGLLRLNEDSRQDIAGPLVCERTTGWQEFGSANYKRASRLVALMRRGTAAQGATPGALEVRVQDDDKPWSQWHQLSVGAPEDYKQRAETYATAGIFTRRRYGIRYSTTEAHSLVSLHDDVDDLEAA